MTIHKELLLINQSAARSLEEGLEETLTIHRLGLYEKLSVSFCTTNCIESVNSGIERISGRISKWKNSGQRMRWMSSAFLEIEPRLRKVKGFKFLSELKQKLSEHRDEIARAA